MRYMLLIHVDEAAGAAIPPEMMAKGMQAYFAYNEALKKAGVWIDGAQLMPSATTTQVTLSDAGDANIADGPYADTKEQIGGYYLIDVKSHDEAIRWAAQCPGANHGTVELRAVREQGGDGRSG